MARIAQEVFTPGSFPTYTYVERASERLEQSLRDALSTTGQVISLSGPSKSGKTVLVERVVGRDCLITVTGANVEEADDLWNRVLDWMDVPQSRGRTTTDSGSLGGELGVEGSATIPGLFSAEGTAKGTTEIGHSSEKTSTYSRRGLTQVVEEIANSDFVVLLDDFHYMPRKIQGEVAKILKEAVRLGVKVCTAAVRHRGDDVVRANPELRGRVRSIDLNYWTKSELAEIAKLGFKELKADVDEPAIERFALESAGSPQLMQLICLNACFVAVLREKGLMTQKMQFSVDMMQRILEQTSSNTDFRSLVDVLDAGPKTRGAERKIYKFNDHSEGDVYRCILKAVAADPPRLSFNYEELTERVASVCQEDVPVGSSVVGTCLHMTKLALDKFPSERAIEWDEQKQILDIPDPYLLFYLRWSGRLQEN